MKVLLIQPPLSRAELFARGSETSASILPPLGLAYIASYLRQHYYECKIIDGIAEDLTIDEIVRIAGDFDVVGVSSVSTFAVRARQLIEKIKELPHPPIVVVGGPHVTVMPKYFLKYGADFAVVGEGEETMLELVKYLERKEKDGAALSKIKGLAFIEQSEYTYTGIRPPIQNLDSIPLPARDLLPMHLYRSSIARDPNQPSLSMFTSRGCPGVCTFCSKATFGTKVRYFSPERIVEEFFVLRDTYGARSIAIWDDNFLSDPNVVMTVCEQLIRRNFGLPFSVEARVDNVSPEVLKNLKKAGCSYIAYGVESGSQRMLDYMNKRIVLEDISKAIAQTKEVGIPIRGYFMMGFPGETIKDIEQTINYAIKLDVELASFTLLVPLPGTLEYRRAQQSGSFDPDYYDKLVVPEFNFPDKPIYVPEGLTERELLRIHRSAYNRYYIRPKMIWRKLSSISSWDDIASLVKGGYTLLVNILKK